MKKIINAIFLLAITGCSSLPLITCPDRPYQYEIKDADLVSLSDETYMKLAKNDFNMFIYVDKLERICKVVENE